MGINICNWLFTLADGNIFIENLSDSIVRTDSFHVPGKERIPPLRHI
jgi:hypothetical protein